MIRGSEEKTLAQVMRRDAAKKIVRGPDGVPICINDLPPAGFSGHWTPRRKALLVLAVRGELLSVREILDRYSMTAEEFSALDTGYESAGEAGLLVKALQSDRPRKGGHDV